jgi:hypothetical protein
LKNGLILVGIGFVGFFAVIGVAIALGFCGLVRAVFDWLDKPKKN